MEGSGLTSKPKCRPPPIKIPDCSFTHRPITVITTNSRSRSVKGLNRKINIENTIIPNAPIGTSPRISDQYIQISQNRKNTPEGCCPDCFKYCI